MERRRLTEVGAPQGARPGQDEEQSLIRRAQKGDHEAFETLLRRHQRRVLSLISHLLRRPADIEDIAQQVLLKVYLALPRFDFRSAFGTWLYRIAVNECYDHLRRQRARKSAAAAEIPVEEVVSLEQLGRSATQPEGLDIVSRTELRQVAEKLFRRLSPDDRLVLTLKELEGFSIEEIGQIMRLRESTVKVRIFRARKRLAEAYRRLVRARSPGS
jgi:RNA polymerase sigma-70 factor (ECF subfamily)